MQNLYCNQFTKEKIRELKPLKEKSYNGKKINLDYHQYELKIQKMMNCFFSDKLNKKIIEEKDKTIEDFKFENKLHNLLILSDLYKNIKIVNQNRINNMIKKDNSLTKEYLSLLFFRHFIKQYNLISTNNVEIYKLIFGKGKRIVYLEDDDTPYEYEVIDIVDYTNNILRVIKEKRLIYKDRKEFVDFAQYIAGIPFFGIEVKTPKANLKAALSDFDKKITYQCFLVQVGTNGTDVFLNSISHSNIFYKWKNYGINKNNFNSGFVDFTNEFIGNISNSLFYVDNCIIEKKSNGKKKLTNGRVQQYFVSKKINTSFKNMSLRETEKKSYDFLKVYFKHHTRTGKSYSFELIANLVFKRYTNLFDKILIFTHDVNSVKKSILAEFDHHIFYDGVIKDIGSKKKYLELLNSNAKGVFIINMQKINEDTNSSLPKTLIDKKSKKTLIFIDEIHTHQNSSLAEIRYEHFPKASIISATATPIFTKLKIKDIIKNFKAKNGKEPKKNELKKLKNQLFDVTADIYGEKIDDLPPSDAEELGLVVKLSTEQVQYKYQNNLNFKTIPTLENVKKETKVLIKNLFLSEDEAYKEKIIENDKLINDNIQLNEYETFLKTDSKKLFSNIDYYKNNKTLLRLQKSFQKTYNEYYLNSSSKIESKLKKEFKLNMFQERFNFIFKTHNEINNNIQKNELIKNEDKFNIKSFWILSSIEEGIDVLIKIKEKIKQNCIDNKINIDLMKRQLKLNIYKGIRFALDVSEIKPDLEQIKKLEEIYEEDFQEWMINGEAIYSLHDKTDIIVDFESKKEDGKIECIDILLLVKKRMMGYDNKELTIVFLDKEIKDVKEILQIATRSTTIRPGKDLGYLFNMSLTEDNFNTLKSSYTLYDNNDLEKVIISTEFKNIIYKDMEKTLNNIETIFNRKEKNIKLLNETNLNFYCERIINSFLKDKDTLSNEYSHFIKELNKITKPIIDIKYQLEKDNKIELKEKYKIILEISAHLYEYIQERKELLNTQFIHSDSDIKTIIEELFLIFKEDIIKTNKKMKESFNKFNINNITGVYSSFKTLEKTKKIKINKNDTLSYLETKRLSNSINNLLNNDSFKNNSMEIFKNLENIKNKIQEQSLTNEIYKKTEKLVEDLELEIKTTIKNDFENRKIFYIINHQLLSIYKKYDNKKDFKIFVKFLADKYSYDIEKTFKDNGIFDIIENQDKKNEIKRLIKNENKFYISTLNNIIEFLKENNKDTILFIKILKENNYLEIISNNKLEDKEKMFDLLCIIIDRMDHY